MTVSREDARRIADLARLELTDDELDRLAGDMRDILGHVDALRAVNIPDDDRGHDHSEPSAPGPGPLRPDEPTRDPLVEGLPSFAPETSSGFITLPRLASHEDEPGPEGEVG